MLSPPLRPKPIALARDVVRGERIMSIAVKHKIGTAGASSPTTFSTVLPITLRGSPANLALQLEEARLFGPLSDFATGAALVLIAIMTGPPKRAPGRTEAYSSASRSMAALFSRQ
jgi:hypothetical protein